jgi:hypothetical protein
VGVLCLKHILRRHGSTLSLYIEDYTDCVGKLASVFYNCFGMILVSFLFFSFKPPPFEKFRDRDEFSKVAKNVPNHCTVAILFMWKRSE